MVEESVDRGLIPTKPRVLRHGTPVPDCSHLRFEGETSRSVPHNLSFGLKGELDFSGQVDFLRSVNTFLTSFQVDLKRFKLEKLGKDTVLPPSD